MKLNKTKTNIRMWDNGINNPANRRQIKNITHAEKTSTLTTKLLRSPGSPGLIECGDFCRTLTIEECEQLQTMPIGYTAMLSKTQALKALGNGWTANVIEHLFNCMFGSLDRNEQIVCLSMYDGIGTGRYVLDKMGFKNITYYAYEIDKNAIKCAKSNYPDIIEMGDAFDVRQDNWKLLKTF